MNKYLFRTLLGGLIWIIPLITSFIVWNYETNQPIIGGKWFNSLMFFTFIVALCISLALWFRKYPKSDFKELIKTSLIWFLQLSFLDFVILVQVFKTPLEDYFPILLTYITVVPIIYVISKIIERVNI